MELKYYNKPWLPAFKGVFLILFGFIAMLGIFGTIKSLGVLFAVLIFMIGILLVAVGVRFKESTPRTWTIVSGMINLGFLVYIILHMDDDRTVTASREALIPVLMIWLIYYAVSEIIEAIILYLQKNAFFALFLINAILTLVFAYFLYIVTDDISEQSVFYIGILAVATGLVNVLTSYMLNRVKA
jgi:uncharacterized membrane protein HdeD (DUF308 family)